MSYKHVFIGLVACAAVAFGTTPKQVQATQAVMHHASQKTHHVSVMFYSGSLRSNLKRLASVYGWKEMVWLPNNDYQWHGTLSVSGKNLDSVLTKVLKNYPLQAQLYDGNRILVIAKRTI